MERKKIRRPTDGTKWWNQPEASPESLIAALRAKASENGYTKDQIRGASTRLLRRMSAPGHDHPCLNDLI